MNDIQSSFARTINERHLGITAASVMTDCGHYGITYGCTINCPVLMRGECELMHAENAELYAECVREHSLENVQADLPPKKGGDSTSDVIGV